ncbi:MAG: hisC [Bacteroidota bacterium]|nr:hisC [Bacteroidota bacterium]
MQNINIKDLVRPHIIDMKPYSSARLEYEGHEGIFLDANENSLGSVCGELHNRYPDPLQIKVKEKLAALENVDIDEIFLGNGSDECIDLLIRAFCEPEKDKIMICPPVFSMYEHSAHSQHIEVTEVLLIPETFQLDVKAIREKMNNVKIIFLCSPNNPTGNLFNDKDIEEILKSFNGLVLIDEAYHDFANNTSWIKRMKAFKNLAVIKTFSKAYGMADARLGMLYANAEIIHYLNTIKLPYNVSEYTQRLALTALDNIDQKNNFIQELINGRKYLQDELSKVSFIRKVYPSDANYILFKVDDADKLYQYLLSKKIIVRNRSKAPLCEGCLRVTVGTREENEKFINALNNYNS